MWGFNGQNCRKIYGFVLLVICIHDFYYYKTVTIC